MDGMRIERRLRLARALDAYELELWALVQRLAADFERTLGPADSPLRRWLVSVRGTAAHAIETRRTEIARWTALLRREAPLREREVRGWFDRGSAWSGG
jgi:hypothetical protein